MRVQLTTPRVDAFGSYSEGAVVTVPDDEGRRMVDAGVAGPARPERVEAATTGPARTAAGRTPARR